VLLDLWCSTGKTAGALRVVDTGDTVRIAILRWFLLGVGVLAVVWALLVGVLVAAGRRAHARALATFVPDCLVLATRLVRDPRVPRRRKLLLVALAAYLALPFDLIPDFVPVLGYLDDLIIVPLGIALLLRIVPPDVLADCRERAALATERPTSRLATLAILGIWLAVALLVGWWAVDRLIG
jgi:uncharacterized membrane protein YkvA (DUF1232 family)